MSRFKDTERKLIRLCPGWCKTPQLHWSIPAWTMGSVARQTYWTCRIWMWPDLRGLKLKSLGDLCVAPHYVDTLNVQISLAHTFLVGKKLLSKTTGTNGKLRWIFHLGGKNVFLLLNFDLSVNHFPINGQNLFVRLAAFRQILDSFGAKISKSCLRICFLW